MTHTNKRTKHATTKNIKICHKKTQTNHQSPYPLCRHNKKKPFLYVGRKSKCKKSKHETNPLSLLSHVPICSTRPLHPFSPPHRTLTQKKSACLAFVPMESQCQRAVAACGAELRDGVAASGTGVRAVRERRRTRRWRWTGRWCGWRAGMRRTTWQSAACRCRATSCCGAALRGSSPWRGMGRSSGSGGTTATWEERSVVMAAVRAWVLLCDMPVSLGGTTVRLCSKLCKRVAFRFSTPATVRSDREVAVAAVRQLGGALEFADDFRSDREVAASYSQPFGDGYVTVSTGAVHVSRLVRTRSRSAIGLLVSVRQRQSAGRSFFCARNCSGSREALMYADDFRNDREVVRAAVRQWGFSLQYTSDSLRGDRSLGSKPFSNQGMRSSTPATSATTVKSYAQLPERDADVCSQRQLAGQPCGGTQSDQTVGLLHLSLFVVRKPVQGHGRLCTQPPTRNPCLVERRPLPSLLLAFTLLET